jgi:hypothetical protein
VRALYDPVLRDGVPDTTVIFAYMGGLVLSYNEKAESLTASHQAMFLWMNEQSKPTVTEMVNEVMPAYTFLLPVKGINEPRWCSGGHIKGLKFGKVPNPHDVPNRILRHPLSRATAFLTTA